MLVTLSDKREQQLIIVLENNLSAGQCVQPCISLIWIHRFPHNIHPLSSFEVKLHLACYRCSRWMISISFWNRHARQSSPYWVCRYTEVMFIYVQILHTVCVNITCFLWSPSISIYIGWFANIFSKLLSTILRSERGIYKPSSF